MATEPERLADLGRIAGGDAAAIIRGLQQLERNLDRTTELIRAERDPERLRTLQVLQPRLAALLRSIRGRAVASDPSELRAWAAEVAQRRPAFAAGLRAMAGFSELSLEGPGLQGLDLVVEPAAVTYAIKVVIGVAAGLILLRYGPRAFRASWADDVSPAVKRGARRVISGAQAESDSILRAFGAGLERTIKWIAGAVIVGLVAQGLGWVNLRKLTGAGSSRSPYE